MKFFNLKVYFKSGVSRSQPYFKKASTLIYKKRTFLILFFIAFLLADLVLLQINKILLPNGNLPPSLGTLSKRNLIKSTRDNYQVIWRKNLFHEGPLPDVRVATYSLYQQEPTQSSLPFQLTGTIVHVNPKRSVATVKSNNEALSYQKGDVIDGKAEINRIERRKIVFFNKDNSLLEYIDIPELNTLTITQQTSSLKSPASSNNIIKQVKSNQFKVNRSDVNTYLKNLPEILQQARVIPNQVKKNGELIMNGFRFASIKKGSVFEKLGFELGDTIKEVNGEVVNTPEKALELFEKLRSSSSVKILVEKDGKDVEYEYNVSEDAPMGN